MAYFTDCSRTTGTDLGVALWQRELWLICTLSVYLGLILLD